MNFWWTFDERLMSFWSSFDDTFDEFLGKQMVRTINGKNMLHDKPSASKFRFDTTEEELHEVEPWNTSAMLMRLWWTKLVPVP